MSGLSTLSAHATIGIGGLNIFGVYVFGALLAGGACLHAAFGLLWGYAQALPQSRSVAWIMCGWGVLFLTAGVLYFLSIYVVWKEDTLLATILQVFHVCFVAIIIAALSAFMHQSSATAAVVCQALTFDKYLFQPDRSSLADTNHESSRRAWGSTQAEARQVGLDKAIFFDTIMDSLGEGLMCCDTQGRHILVNRSAKVILGHHLRQGHPWGSTNPSALFHPEQEIPFTEEELPLYQALQGKSVRNMHAQLKLDATEVKMLSLTAFPVWGSKNEVIAAIVMIKDITEKNLLEQQFEIALDAAPNGMIMVDAQGKIAYANKNVSAIFGYTNEELVGTSIESLVPHDIRHQHRGYTQSFMRNSRQRVMGEGKDLYGIKKNTQSVPLEIGLTPIDTLEGKFVVASILDITERKKYLHSLSQANQRLQTSQMELEKLNIRLAQKNVELEQFVYTVSHDLKAPLVSISAYAEKVSRSPSLLQDARMSHYITRILKNAETMNLLLNDLLNFSKVSYKELQLSRFNLAQLVGKAVAILDTAMREYRAVVEYDIDPELEITTQEHLFAQIMTNLVSNALKYHHPDRTPHIQCTVTQEEEGRLVLALQDNGLGIPKEQHSKVFKIFERFHPEVTEGTGVGLTIVRKIVERHGWSIDFCSEENIGTTFKIYMPAVPKQGGEVV
ncbi:MAG: PAS domain S-box protein [Zetaproteobacteria bacterium]|nr:PAS domain S-box protein [Zetaproteobacteria bacterium]